MLTNYDISLATLNDVAGILTLQEPNLPDNGGSLSVRQPAERLRYKAHRKMGMWDLGTFVHENVPYIAFKYST